MNLNDPKEFDDTKGILIGSMDFDNSKVYGDTSITDGLVVIVVVDDDVDVVVVVVVVLVVVVDLLCIKLPSNKQVYRVAQ